MNPLKNSTETNSPTYYKIPNVKEIFNAFTVCTKTKKNPPVTNAESDTAVFLGTTQNLLLCNYSTLPKTAIPTTAYILLITLLHICEIENRSTPAVQISLSDFARIRKAKSTTSIRNQLLICLPFLSNLSFSTNNTTISIFQEPIQIHSGIIVAVFSSDMFKLIKESNSVFIHEETLSINISEFPNGFYLGIYIDLLLNKPAKRRSQIKLASILHSIPTYSSASFERMEQSVFIKNIVGKLFFQLDEHFSHFELQSSQNNEFDLYTETLKLYETRLKPGVKPLSYKKVDQSLLSYKIKVTGDKFPE